MTGLITIAHRGGQRGGPENSLAAIADAVQLGVDAIEIDLWAIDGQLLVAHDRRLGRTIAGTGRFDLLNKSQLTELELANGEAIPTLAQVVALLTPEIELNIEIKGAATAAPLCRWLQAHFAGGGRPQQFILSSFDHPQLMQCKNDVPEVRRGVLVEGVPLDVAALCAQLGAYCFNPSINFVSYELIAAAKKYGAKTFVYTVNHPDDWQLMKDWGVDGVFTDVPEQLLAWQRD